MWAFLQNPIKLCMASVFLKSAVPLQLTNLQGSSSGRLQKFLSLTKKKGKQSMQTASVHMLQHKSTWKKPLCPKQPWWAKSRVCLPSWRDSILLNPTLEMLHLSAKTEPVLYSISQGSQWLERRPLSLVLSFT